MTISRFCMQATNLLRVRNCSLIFYQNASKNVLNTLKENIFPPKPKKPLTPFLLYLREVRSKFVEQDPSLKQSEIVKKISKQWAELDPVKKESYQIEYKNNYEVYTQKLEEYNNSITDEQKQLWEDKKNEHKENVKVSNIKRKSGALGKPKKPMSAFFSYVAEKKFEKDPNISFKDWLESTTKTWKQMSNAEKKPYIDQATESMEQYKKQLYEWEIEMMNLGHTDIVRQMTLLKQKHVKDEQ